MKRPIRPTALALAVVLALPLAAQNETGTQTGQAERTQTQQSLREILDGGTPKTVADLRAMEAHTKKLLEQVLPRTVTCNGASGVIVKGGYVLTCAHVTRQANKDILIILQDGTRLSGRSLGLNHGTDAGLVKILGKPEDIAKLPYAEMGRIKDLKVGQWVAMLGQTGGRKTWRIPPLRLGRMIKIPNQNYITSDCTMAAGDSGGPLFDMDGRVVGINSRINGRLENNMHVPIDAFHQDWEKFVKGEVIGRSRRGGRGPAELGAIADPNVEDKAQVLKVTPGSPAAKAGIQVGDVIVSFKRGGERRRRLRSPNAMKRRLSRYRAGDRVKVLVRRGEEQLELDVTLAARKERRRQRPGDQRRRREGRQNR